MGGKLASLLVADDEMVLVTGAGVEFPTKPPPAAGTGEAPNPPNPPGAGLGNPKAPVAAAGAPNAPPPPAGAAPNAPVAGGWVGPCVPLFPAI